MSFRRRLVILPAAAVVSLTAPAVAGAGSCTHPLFAAAVQYVVGSASQWGLSHREFWTTSGSKIVSGAAGFGTIQQGALETSNVNVVSEITNLITAQRAYEMNSRVIKAADEMLSSVVQLR